MMLPRIPIRPSLRARRAHTRIEVVPRHIVSARIVHRLGRRVRIARTFVERLFVREHKVHELILVKARQVHEARFDHIAVALRFAVLTRKGPLRAGRRLLLVGIAVGINGEVHHIRPVLARPRLLQRTRDVPDAAGSERFVVQAEAHLGLGLHAGEKEC